MVSPDDTLGTENLTYSFVVTAFSDEQASVRVNAILATGIRAPVSSNVIVVSYDMMLPTITGARMLSRV
jgi:hypothetical protein